MDDNDRAGVLVQSWERPGETIAIYRLPGGQYKIVRIGVCGGTTYRPNRSLATVAAFTQMTADWRETTPMPAGAV